MTVTRLCVAATTALGTVALLTPPAGAAIVYELQEDVDVRFPIVCDRGTSDPTDDLSLEQHLTGSVQVRVKQRGPDGGLWYESRGSLAETTTNIDNGQSWSATTDFFEHETHALEVVDATTRRIVINEHVRFRVYDPAGDLDSQTVGLQQVELVVSAGAPDPADDEVEFVDVIRQAGKDETSADICDDAVRFTAD